MSPAGYNVEELAFCKESALIIFECNLYCTYRFIADVLDEIANSDRKEMRFYMQNIVLNMRFSRFKEEQASILKTKNEYDYTCYVNFASRTLVLQKVKELYKRTSVGGFNPHENAQITYFSRKRNDLYMSG